MVRTIFLAAAGTLALAACSGSVPAADASQEAIDPVAPATTAPAPSPGEAALPAGQAAPSASPAPAPPAPNAAVATTATPPIDKSERGARAVLTTWARALETQQFALAWAQFVNPPASKADFTRWWQRYRTIRVSLGPGEGDAAMGSSYYTAPATLTGMTVAGKPFRLQGDVVVRRVNDINGATPEQLRWHIGSADLKDVSDR